MDHAATIPAPAAPITPARGARFRIVADTARRRRRSGARMSGFDPGRRLAAEFFVSGAPS
jgi:hypothetical protein